MKLLNILSALFILFTISCCVNNKQKDDDQIKQTVKNYWKAVKNNEAQDYLNLIENNDEYNIAFTHDLYYLHKNYRKLDANKFLSREVKIQNTRNFGGNHKYVEYIFIKPNSIVEPLTVTLYFDKKIGYNKIYSVEILGNMPEWEN